MRNGNFAFFAVFFAFSLGSYRTYEEWKLSNPFFLSKETIVLTVPMRNGNWKAMNELEQEV